VEELLDSTLCTYEGPLGKKKKSMSLLSYENSRITAPQTKRRFGATGIIFIIVTVI
jgi:hypothetical protein